jgi:thiamine pyrophosphate-dependent acetolactate synthase large subunit-like protein
LSVGSGHLEMGTPAPSSARNATVAEAAIRRLRAHGVRRAFGIPGTHNLPLYRELARYEIEHVSPRHEQGAGFAADGYARAGGRGPAVCIVTSGPGIMNAATAIATAHADSVPMIILAAGMSDSVLGSDSGYLHEMPDQRVALGGVTHAASRVNGAAAVESAIDSAFASFDSGRPRPAYIEIPHDVMDAPGGAATAQPAPTPKLHPEEPEIAAAAELLDSADQVTLVLGGGAVDAGAEALWVARMLDAPVITTINGKGTVPEDDPVSLGASLRLGSAQELLCESDVVVAVGTELAQSDLWRDPPLPFSGELIRIDVDGAQMHKNGPCSVPLVADAAAALEMLGRRLRTLERRDRGLRRAGALRDRVRSEALADGAPYVPLMDRLEAGLADDSIVVADSTMASYYGAVHFLTRRAPRCFLHPTGYAPLGYAIPAAVGAKLAQPDREVLALIGDGGAMFSFPELAMAVELDLPLVVLVVNDAGYGEIRREMIAREQPPLGVDLPSPDFCGLARSLGADAAAAGLEELPERLREAFAARGPTMLELRLT